ncbi:MAG: hypothetical protein WCX81_01230 [Monoglobales bacterium]
MNSKKMLAISVLIGVANVVAGLVLIIISSLFQMDLWIRVLLSATAVLVIGTGIVCACILDKNAGTFECKNCNHKFTPTMMSYICGAHTFNKRRLKCPACKKVSWCRHKFD